MSFCILFLILRIRAIFRAKIRNSKFFFMDSDPRTKPKLQTKFHRKRLSSLEDQGVTHARTDGEWDVSSILRQSLMSWSHFEKYFENYVTLKTVSSVDTTCCVDDGHWQIAPHCPRFHLLWSLRFVLTSQCQIYCIDLGRLVYDSPLT